MISVPGTFRKYPMWFGLAVIRFVTVGRPIGEQLADFLEYALRFSGPDRFGTESRKYRRDIYVNI